MQIFLFLYFSQIDNEFLVLCDRNLTQKLTMTSFRCNLPHFDQLRITSVNWERFRLKRDSVLG